MSTESIEFLWPVYPHPTIILPPIKIKTINSGKMILRKSSDPRQTPAASYHPCQQTVLLILPASTDLLIESN